MTDHEIAALACPPGTTPGPIAADMTDHEVAANSGGMLTGARARARAAALAARMAAAMGARHGWTPAQIGAAASAAARIPTHAIDHRGRMVGCLVEPVISAAASRVSS